MGKETKLEIVISGCITKLRTKADYSQITCHWWIWTFKLYYSENLLWNL